MYLKSKNEVNKDMRFTNKHRFPSSIETNAAGHDALGAFYQSACRYRNTQFTLDWESLTFMDANLSALLLAMTWKLRKENNLNFYLDMSNLKGGMNVFLRNGLAHYVYKKLPAPGEDVRESTIPIKAFKINDVDKFMAFIERDLMRHRGMEEVLYSHKQQLIDNFVEVFSNVELHTNTQNPVLACGQFFPGKKELKFTLVDIGCGFLNNIAAFTRDQEKPVRKADEAITWAVKGHSTKQEAAGGTGLSRILNYCRKNNGGLHIVSDGCYWAFDNGKIECKTLSANFPGATIHLIFRFA